VFSRHVEIKLAEIGNLKKAQGSRAEAVQATH